MPWIRFLGSLKIWALSTVGGGGEEIKCPHATWNRARIFKLLRAPGTDSKESIPYRYQFHHGNDSWEGEGVHPAKLIPALKINIYWTWPTGFHTWFLLNSRN